MCRILIALLAACLAGCGGSKPDPVKENPAHVPKKDIMGREYSGSGYDIAYPEDWEKQKGVMGTDSVALSPQEGPTDKFRENVGVVIEELPQSMTAEQYMQHSQAAMATMMTDFQLKQSSAFKLGEHDSFRIDYAFKMGQFEMDNIAFLVVAGKTGYVITCSATTDSKAQYENQFLDIVKTFKVK